jgi:hypothetical protein
MRLDVLAVCYTLAGTDLLPVAARFCCRRWEQVAEEQVRGEIDCEDEEEESNEEVRGGGAVGAMEEGIFQGEIEILVGDDDARGDEDGDEDRGLQFPAATIVAEEADRPEQDEGQDDVEKREEAGPERSAAVEKVFGATD